MKFSADSLPISKLPLGTICMSELDVDEDDQFGCRYVVEDKNSSLGYVHVVRSDPKTGERGRARLPGTMRVYEVLEFF